MTLTERQQHDRIPHLWATGLHDTKAIEALTGIPEADVCRILHADRERRRAGR